MIKTTIKKTFVLSRQEVKELKDIFAIFDKDDKGYVTLRELERLVTGDGDADNDKENKEIMKANEATDKDLIIDFNEFMKIILAYDLLEPNLARSNEDREEEVLRSAFDTFDIDGNGYIDLHELENLFHVLNEKLTSDELNFILRTVDKDGDGKLNFSEFKEFFKSK